MNMKMSGCITSAVDTAYSDFRTNQLLLMSS